MVSLNQWDPAWNTGVAEIDAEHQHLWQILRAFQDAYMEFGPAVTVGVLDEMVDYTSYHFGNEERQLELRKYARLPEHKQAHADLKRQLLTYCDTIKKTTDREALTVDVGVFFQEWIVQHILEMDFAAFRGQ